MYAIISAGNKQYKVSQGETIYIDKVNQADGSAISFDAIMVVNEGDVKVGTPTVAGVTVEGKIVGQVKGEKIKIYKYKSKKNEKPGFFARTKKYFASVKSEMKRVTWPDKKELVNYSVVVCASLIVVGVVIALLDAGFGEALALFSGLRG